MTETLDETETTETPEEPETPAEAPEVPDGPEPDEEREEPEEEPEPVETPPAADEAHMEQVFDQARRRAKTYMRDVPKILGAAAADLHMCPLCTDLLPGFVLDPKVKPVVGDQLVAVKLAIGEGLPVEYVNADDAEQCQACRGEGKVRTGSHVPKQDVLRCRHCKGRGWIGPRSASVAETETTENGYVDHADAPPLEETPPVDPWGRVKGDPLYGIFPGYEPE